MHLFFELIGESTARRRPAPAQLVRKFIQCERSSGFTQSRSDRIFARFDRLRCRRRTAAATLGGGAFVVRFLSTMHRSYSL
jgi:hypothetical protein